MYKYDHPNTTAQARNGMPWHLQQLFEARHSTLLWLRLLSPVSRIPCKICSCHLHQTDCSGARTTRGHPLVASLTGACVSVTTVPAAAAAADNTAYRGGSPSSCLIQLAPLRCGTTLCETLRPTRHCTAQAAGEDTVDCALRSGAWAAGSRHMADN